MILLVQLTDDYFCYTDDGLPPQLAFIDTVTDRFLETEDGSHLFDTDDIDMHPQAERLRPLVPRQFNLSPSLANAIIDMEDIAFSEGRGLVMAHQQMLGKP